MDVVNYSDTANRMDVPNVSGPIISHHEIRMQDINSVEDERRSVWIKETHVVSSTPIRARNIRRDYVLPSRRPSTLRYSVPGSPGVSPVRKSTSFYENYPSHLRELPDQPVNALKPQSPTPTHAPNNNSRRAANHEAYCIQGKREIQQNVSKWAPKYCASQRVEQYMPLVVLSDDEGERPANNYAAEVRMNGCRRKRVTISKPTFPLRSSNKGTVFVRLPSKRGSIETEKGASDAVSSGIRKVNSDGRGCFDEGSVNNDDHESSIDSGLSHDPGKDVYVHQNVIDQPLQRISGLKTVQASKSSRDVTQEIRKNAMSQLISSIHWKSGRNSDYEPLVVVSADEETGAAINKKNRGAKPVKGCIRKGLDQENNAAGRGQRGILKKPNGGRLLKNIVISNSNFANDEYIVERAEVGDEIQFLTGERFNPDGSVCSDVDQGPYKGSELSCGGLQTHLNKQKDLWEGFGRIGNRSQCFGSHTNHQNFSLDEYIDENDFEMNDERSVNVSGPINRNSHRELAVLLDNSYESYDEQDDEYFANKSGPIHRDSYRHGDHCPSPNFKSSAKANKFDSRADNLLRRKVMSQCCSQTESFEDGYSQNISGNYEKTSNRKPKKSVARKHRPSIELAGDKDHKDSTAKKKRSSPHMSHPNKGTAECTPNSSNVIKKRGKMQKSPTEYNCSQEVSRNNNPASGRRPKKTVVRKQKSPITSSDDADNKAVGNKRKRGRPRLSNIGESKAKGNDCEKKRVAKKSRTEPSDGTCSQELTDGDVVTKDEKSKKGARKHQCNAVNKKVGVKRKPGRPRASPSLETVPKEDRKAAETNNENIRVTKQQKSLTTSSEDSISQEVLGDGGVKKRKRGRPKKSSVKSSDEGQESSCSSKSVADNKKSQRLKRKKDSDDSETDANRSSKRRNLLNPVTTKSELSLSQNGGNLIPFDMTQKTSANRLSGPAIAKRNVQGESSSDYLRKKVLTMKLGTSVFQKSIIENDEKIMTSTPKRPVSDRRSSSSSVETISKKPVSDLKNSFTPSDGSEAAQVTEGSAEQNDNNAALNNSPVNKLNRSLRRNEDKYGSISKTGSKPDISISKQDSASKHEKNHSKVNESINKLNSEKSKSLNTSSAAFSVDEKVLDLPSKSSSVNDTQSTLIGRSNVSSSRRGSIKTVVDGKEMELALLAEYSRLAFSSRHEGTKHQDDKVRYGAALDVLGLGTGYIHLAPGKEKGLQHPKLYNMVFLILDGNVEVRIHETELLLRPGDFFAVPKGCKYNLIGRGDKNAVIAYFKCKAV